MEKKAKIIATLGPAIYKETKLKQLVNLGVDAFRINFSHNTNGMDKIVSRIRKIEKSTNKKISLIADLQGVKLRVNKIKNDNQKIKYNQKYIFDNKKELGNINRITFPYPKILQKLKKGNKILVDDGKFVFVVIKKLINSVTTVCKSQNCFMRSNKSVHIQNFDIPFNKLTNKDKKDIKKAISFLSKINSHNFSQGVVVRNDKVLIVEGIRGTQQMLNETKKQQQFLSGVLVKLPKKKQDLRIDLPAVGLKTLYQCKKAGLKGIVLKNKQNICLNKKLLIQSANKNRMFIVVK